MIVRSLRRLTLTLSLSFALMVAGAIFSASTYGAAVAAVTSTTTGESPAVGSVQALASSGDGYCALLSSGGVACWGQGHSGQLGHGGFGNSARPVNVKGVGGNGTLTGVASLGDDSGRPRAFDDEFSGLLGSG